MAKTTSPRLRIFAANGAAKPVLRRPAKLAHTFDSLAPLPKDEMPDLYGYRPRSRKKQLTQAQQDVAVVLLTLGYPWTQIIRHMFSPDAERLLSIDHVSSANYSAAIRYLQYLRRQRVMTTRCRRGEIGLLRELGIDQVTAVRAYHGKSLVALRQNA